MKQCVSEGNKLKDMWCAWWKDKQAEKHKSCKMKEGWMKNDEGWQMNDEGWWFEAVEGFLWLTDWLTDWQTNRHMWM